MIPLPCESVSGIQVCIASYLDSRDHETSQSPMEKGREMDILQIRQISLRISYAWMHINHVLVSML